ncbi:hypothetical protein [Hymenobacter elongatus]|uniref:Lipoprotein n=1 Tax=Hymenobacter elongatus TaxID=877208 RepID=A0A4Z0PG90_9BACT|nr:hypothetical protein [Hymenobacter elongatus]TGE14143.1 hypothetical protein E5J99_17535 [Hymenobacter elongatus]
MLRASQYVSVLLFLFSGLTACKKEAEAPTAPVRLFSNGREIKDETVKWRFAKQSGTFFTDPPTLSDPNFYVQYLKPDTAVFGKSSLTFIDRHSGEQHLFYSPYLVQVRNPDDLLRLCLKYKGPLLYTLPTNGYAYLTQEVRVGYMPNGASSIRLSVLRYRCRQTTSGYIDIKGLLFNEFDETVISRVPAGDTVAIQESSVTIPVQR